MATSEELEMTFKKVGNDFGTEATAEFAEFRDLKVKWTRTINFADFRVSDYLMEAPVDVIEDIARTIYSKIFGDGKEYSEETVGWLTSDEFVKLHQPKFIERSRNFRFDDGENKSISESIQRLKDAGLAPDDLGKTKIMWSTKTSENKDAWSSCLMRTISINSKLDSEDVPDDVLDYTILKHLTFIGVEFGVDGAERERIVNEKMESHTEYADAQKWLENHELTA